MEGREGEERMCAVGFFNYFRLCRMHSSHCQSLQCAFDFVSNSSFFRYLQNLVSLCLLVYYLSARLFVFFVCIFFSTLCMLSTDFYRTSVESDK